MIINIRGTSGSGKSHLVKHIMSMYVSTEANYIKGRKQPLWYLLHNDEHEPELAVVGQYETACGGGDSISKVQDMFDLVNDLDSQGYHVIFEDMRAGAYEWRRTVELHDIRVIFLNTPLEQCINDVNKRRRERGVMAPASTKNTEAKYKCCLRMYPKLLELSKTHENLQVFNCNRTEARVLVEEMLEL